MQRRSESDHRRAQRAASLIQVESVEPTRWVELVWVDVEPGVGQLAQRVERRHVVEEGGEEEEHDEQLWLGGRCAESGYLLCRRGVWRSCKLCDKFDPSAVRGRRWVRHSELRSNNINAHEEFKDKDKKVE